MKEEKFNDLLLKKGGIKLSITENRKINSVRNHKLRIDTIFMTPTTKVALDNGVAENRTYLLNFRVDTVVKLFLYVVISINYQRMRIIQSRWYSLVFLSFIPGLLLWKFERDKRALLGFI